MSPLTPIRFCLHLGCLHDQNFGAHAVGLKLKYKANINCRCPEITHVEKIGCQEEPKNPPGIPEMLKKIAFQPVSYLRLACIDSKQGKDLCSLVNIALDLPFQWVEVGDCMRVLWSTYVWIVELLTRDTNRNQLSRKLTPQKLSGEVAFTQLT